MVRPLRSCLLAVMTVVATTTLGPAAPPSFVVEEGLQFTYPIPQAQNNALTFLLAARDGTIKNVKVHVKQVKDPRQQPMSLNAVTVEPAAIAEVGGDGVAIALKPDRAQLGVPGDYTILVSVVGQDEKNMPVVAPFIKVVLHRPVAEINVDQLKDRTLELTRYCPCGGVSARVPLTLRETSGKADLTDVHVTVDSLLTKEGKNQVPGTITVEGPKNPISAGDGAELVLHFKDYSTAGTYTTEVTVTSPSLGGSKTIPLTVRVTDAWGWPMLAIAVGVLGGFITHFLVENWRPRRVNDYTAERLKADLRHYRGCVIQPAKLDTLAAIADLLRDAEEKNNLGDANGARTQLATVATQLDAFRKKEATEKADARTRFANLKGDVDSYQRQRQGNALPQERAFFQEASRAFQQADDQLSEDAVDRAVLTLNAVQRAFDDVRKLVMAADLDALAKRLAALNAPASNAKTDVEQKIKDARQLLENGKLDDARQKLKEIQNGIDTVERSLPAGARPALPLAAQAFMLAGLPLPREQPRLLVNGDARQWTTDLPVSFTLTDPNHAFQAGDTFRWYFGDGTASRDTQQPETSHRFAEADDYDVKVEVRRGPTLDLAPNLPVFTATLSVLPGRSERKLGAIAREIHAGDVLFSVIALLVACLTGLLYLYVGKTFGTLADYLLAILWGFGIDQTVRGFAAVSKKIGTTGA